MERIEEITEEKLQEIYIEVYYEKDKMLYPKTNPYLKGRTMNQTQRMTKKAMKLLTKESDRLKAKDKPQSEYSKMAIADKAIEAMLGEAK